MISYPYSDLIRFRNTFSQDRIKKIKEMSASEILKIIPSCIVQDGSGTNIIIPDSTLKDWDKPNKYNIIGYLVTHKAELLVVISPQRQGYAIDNLK